MIRRLFILACSLLYYPFGRSIEALRRITGRRTSCDMVHLTYHAIKPHQRAKFASQMDEVKKSGHPVFAGVPAGAADGGRSIAVTFDDGFRSLLENALPVLAERNIPATIFVPAGYPGMRAGWIAAEGHPNFNETVLSRQDLERLSPDLVRIGSHTVTHPRLTALDDGLLREELVNSRLILEQAVKRPVDLLSYPYGQHNSRIEALSEEAGYAKVFSNVPLPSGDENGFVAGRINVSPEDWMLEYWLKLRGAYQWLAVAILFKRKLSVHADAVRRV